MHFEKYPFEKLNELLQDIQPNENYELSSLTIGEPQFKTPSFIQNSLKNNTQFLSKYPKTKGEDYLKDSMLNFIRSRFHLILQKKQFFLQIQDTTLEILF